MAGLGEMGRLLCCVEEESESDVGGECALRVTL